MDYQEKLYNEEMEKRTCKTCRFFDRIWIYNYTNWPFWKVRQSKIDNNVRIDAKGKNLRPTKFGNCLCNRFEYGVALDEYSGKISDKTKNFYYEDGEGSSAYLEIGEDFGCIHHEAKNEQT